ncbi:TIGR03769 domain-containing protein [Tenggerimyces flavus]|uniref:TIGR03769 domain-containing protein n=1 Tax=Tenggerimyces flavus TaxID=1708749 RepID=UPI0035581F37
MTRSAFRWAHEHGNWAFTKEGVYELTSTHSAQLAGGTTSSEPRSSASPSATSTFRPLRPPAPPA